MMYLDEPRAPITQLIPNKSISIALTCSSSLSQLMIYYQACGSSQNPLFDSVSFFPLTSQIPLYQGLLIQKGLSKPSKALSSSTKFKWANKTNTSHASPFTQSLLHSANHWGGGGGNTTKKKNLTTVSLLKTPFYWFSWTKLFFIILFLVAIILCCSLFCSKAFEQPWHFSSKDINHIFFLSGPFFAEDCPSLRS